MKPRLSLPRESGDRSLNNLVSRRVSSWLAHPTGFTQAVLITVGWFAVPTVFAWSETSAIFWYLAFCTFISFATQFTIGYQNDQTSKALNQMLRNQMDTMKLLVAMAKEIQGDVDKILEDLEELAND